MQRICFENERRMREVPYQLSASDSALFSHDSNENSCKSMCHSVSVNALWFGKK